MKENKIVVFANKKGGVGKSTCCIALADYLTLAKVPVVVVDADNFQPSIVDLREEDSHEFEGEAPWQILSLDTSKKKTVLDGLDLYKQIPGTVLIDCPGNISDDAVKYIYAAADVIVIPMDFSTMTVQATKSFAELLQRMKDAGAVKAKLYFLPNKFDERRKQLRREEIKSQLGSYGYVGTRINNRADIERISTYNFPAKLKGYFRFAYEDLTQFIYDKKIVL